MTTKNLWVLAAALGLVAVACGAGTSADTSAPTTATSSTAATSTAGTAGTSVATTAAPTTSGAPPSSSTTNPPVVQADCVGLAPLSVVPGTSTLTFIREGRMWAQGSDGSVTCLFEVGRSEPFQWRPAGDAVLFSQGTIYGPDGALRSALPDQGVSIGWTRPTGTSTLLVTEPALSKTSVDGGTTTALTPLDAHMWAAYHPDGTTIAVAGSLGDQSGVWISGNDGDSVQALALAEPTVLISDMVFSNDARWLVFVADHTDDPFSDGRYHLHTVDVVPIELEDGVMALGSGGEFNAIAHFSSAEPLDSVVVPAGGSGTGAYPDVIALAEGTCGPDRRALLVDPGDASTTVLLDRPGVPVGFLPAEAGEVRIVVATSDDGCDGPFEWIEVIVDAEGSITFGFTGTGADALAIHSVAPTVDITLSGVVIEPFA